jgi:DNA-binding NarL/FixJ family response regulator
MNQRHRLRVILAGDHAIVLEGLKALVDGEPDMTVIAATTDGSAVVDLVEELRPDVVVLDLDLSGIKGAAVLAALRKRPA